MREPPPGRDAVLGPCPREEGLTASCEASPEPVLRSGSLRVARAVGAGLSQGGWPTQLRRRLGIFALIYAIIFGLILAKAALDALATGRGDAGSLVVGVLLTLTVGTAWSLLVGRRPASPDRLRAVEVGLFGALAAAALAYGQYKEYLGGWGAEWYGRGLGRDADVDPMALPWVFLILCYGIFIPTSGRRCVLVAGALAACPLVVGIAAGADDASPGRVLAAIPQSLPTAGWVLAAAAAAVLGAHQIDTLERAVREARTLGQYRLKRRLGAAGMGEVFLAEHVLLRRPCALKLIRPELAGDERSLRLFENEVRATASLTHPNTVEIYDYGLAEDGTFYCAMEYLPGRSLQETVDTEGPLPPALVVHLLRQVCGALAEAHAAGLVHRDIKPGNILVCERGGIPGVAKLLDFGLVQADPGGRCGPVDRESSIRGVPAYMSPEQAAGAAALDARSDLYSLGAAAYCLLTGRPPFVRDSAIRTLYAHVHELPEPLAAARADVPAELAAIVLRCLAKDSDDRFPSAEALADALAGCRATGEGRDVQFGHA